MEREKEPFLSGVFSMEWKRTPGAGQTVEEFVLQRTCGKGSNGELGIDKHNHEMDYENTTQSYEVTHYSFRHRIQKLGENFNKNSTKILIMTICDGVYQVGGLHEVSVNKNGNI